MHRAGISGIVAILVTIVCTMPIKSYAASGCDETWDCPYEWCETINAESVPEACVDERSFYIGGYRIYNCSACATGYTQTKYSITAPGGCTVDYFVCEIDCPDCADGCPDTAWKSVGNYQYNYSRYCDCGTCRNNTTQYRCAPGYYGSGTNCTQCPEAPSTYTNTALSTKARGTSEAGTTSQSGCYLPASTYYDASGTLTISGTSCTY